MSSKVICACGCEMVKSSMTKHLLTKKHLDLMATKVIKPVEAVAIDEPVKAIKVEAVVDEPVVNNGVVIPKKFTKTDYIEMLDYHINIGVVKGRNKIANLHKNTMPRLEELLIQYGVVDKNKTYTDMMINYIKHRERLDKLTKLREDEEAMKEKRRVEKKENDKEAYNKQPDEVKALCEMKLQYERYTEIIKAYHQNTIDTDTFVKDLKRKGVKEYQIIKLGVINVRGININFETYPQEFYEGEAIYLNKCIDELISEIEYTPWLELKRKKKPSTI
jgi:hypothetical protein